MTGVHVDELVLADARGVWAVRSASQTVYFIDADTSLLLRRTGPESSPGPGDGRWVPLVAVQALFRGDVGVVRVGDRHRYLYDWDPEGSEYGFWSQRLVTSIDHVSSEGFAELPAFPQDPPL